VLRGEVDSTLASFFSSAILGSLGAKAHNGCTRYRGNIVESSGRSDQLMAPDLPRLHFNE
jgi:hypothetical protein